MHLKMDLKFFIIDIFIDMQCNICIKLDQRVGDKGRVNTNLVCLAFIITVRIIFIYILKLYIIYAYIIQVSVKSYLSYIYFKYQKNEPKHLSFCSKVPYKKLK